jgi:hypothetical protein
VHLVVCVLAPSPITPERALAARPDAGPTIVELVAEPVVIVPASYYYWYLADTRIGRLRGRRLSVPVHTCTDLAMYTCFRVVDGGELLALLVHSGAFLVTKCAWPCRGLFYETNCVPFLATLPAMGAQMPLLMTCHWLSVGVTGTLWIYRQRPPALPASAARCLPTWGCTCFRALYLLPCGRGYYLKVGV